MSERGSGVRERRGGCDGDRLTASDYWYSAPDSTETESGTANLRARTFEGLPLVCLLAASHLPRSPDYKLPTLEAARCNALHVTQVW